METQLFYLLMILMLLYSGAIYTFIVVPIFRVDINPAVFLVSFTQHIVALNIIVVNSLK